ncbi:MAG: leucyl aminopeptidase [Planctomycetaceae bacterium]
MQFKIDQQPWHKAKASWLVVGVAQDEALPKEVAELDKLLGGKIARLRERSDFDAKCGDQLSDFDVAEIAAERLLLVGLGKSSELTIADFEKAMRTAARTISAKPDQTAAIGIAKSTLTALGAERCGQTIATAFIVGGIGQDLYKAKPDHHPLETVTLLVGDKTEQKRLEAGIDRGTILGEAINLTRELVNRSPDDIYPESFAERARKEAKACGLACTVLNERDLANERMGSLLAVARGSQRPPRVVVLEYRGGRKKDAPLALVGKGVTFDSGGLSLKLTDSMVTMKCDMAGAATVLGAMTAIARLKLPVNVIGYMGLVENMVSGTSYKLGDVLTARNGVTIEVLNTDAEGRLVLADVLSYAVDKGADRLIDLATLTGACIVALGEEVTGVFSNNQQWCDKLLDAARTCGESAWQMPMVAEYAELLKSDVADCKNIGSRWGGAITAAKFLEKFVGEKPWVHLDIAGPSFATGNKPHREGGATGCMLRTLVEIAGGHGSAK